VIVSVRDVPNTLCAKDCIVVHGNIAEFAVCVKKMP